MRSVFCCTVRIFYVFLAENYFKKNIFVMKNLFFITVLLLVFSSCFRTHAKSQEEIEEAQLRDSLRMDSVNKRRNTPDTATVSFQRANVCDSQLMIVFDRIKVLSGDEAAEYALRHKRFGNNLNVIVNKEVTLETLPIREDVPVYVFKKNFYHCDTLKDGNEYIKTDLSAFSRDKNIFSADQLMEIIILHRSIVYVKQKELE